MSDSITSTSQNLSAAMLQALAALSLKTFDSEADHISAILDTIADQLKVRTPFIASTQAGLFEIIETVNRQGCNLRAGATLPLGDSY